MLLEALHWLSAHAPHLAAGGVALLGGGITTNIPTNIHMNSGSILGLGAHVHLGSANFDADLPESGNQTTVLDVLGYAAAPGHTDRANATDFDTKMHDLYGGDYDNLAGTYKDAIFANWRALVLLIKSC